MALQPLENFIERIAREFVPDPEVFLVPPDTTVLTSFAAEAGPAALFLTCSKNDENYQTLTVTSSLIPGFSSVIALVKHANPLNFEEPMGSQIFPIAIPNPSEGNAAESLHAVLHYVLSPFFEATASSNVATAGANIAAARQKIAELELSFFNLQYHTEIQLIDLPLNELADQEWTQTPDTNTLNSLQATVNLWKKSIRNVTRITRDPLSGSASEEIMFWHSMEQALEHINAQLQTPQIKSTIELLERGKRFHATVGFPADTNLSETMDMVLKYNILLKDLPINDLLTATDFTAVSQALDNIFSHLSKKLRPSAYPVWRSLALVESISSDLDKVVREILGKRKLVTIPFDQFQLITNQVHTLFTRWDDHIREFTNIARDVIRKRSEKFIPVRINPKHAQLKERLDYIIAFRTHHEKLLAALTSVARSDPELDKLNFVSKISNEYLRLNTIDVLDFSSTGIKEWDIVEQQYNNVSGAIEGEIAVLLRSRLKVAKSSHDMFRVLGKFNALFTRPAIRGAIQEYQTRLLEVVKSDISELQHRVGKHYSHSYAFTSAKSQDIPSISGLVIWLNQIRGRLDTLLNRVSSVLGQDWQLYADGENLYNECMQFRQKIDAKPIVNEWVKSITSKKFFSDEPLFIVKKGKLSVNFDPQLGCLFKELRGFSAMKFHVPHSFSSLAQMSRQIYPYAVRLIDDLKVLHECMDVYIDEPQSKALVQNDLNQVHALLIEGSKQTWKSLTNTLEPQPQLLVSLDQAVSALEVHTKDSLLVTRHIRETLEELDDCDYSREAFAGILDRIDALLSRIGLTSSNLPQFSSRVHNAANAKLTRRCEYEIGEWLTSYSPIFEHHLTLSSQVITVVPPLETTRVALFGELCRITAEIPAKFELEIEETIKKVILETNQIFNEAKGYLETWFAFQGLWDLKNVQVFEELGTSLEDWLQALKEINDSRSKLDDDHQKKRFGKRIVIEFGQIHSFINTKFDVWQNDMTSKFSNLVADKSIELLGYLRKQRSDHEQISFGTGNTELLAQHLKTVKQVESQSDEILKTLNLLKEAQSSLGKYRFQFPKNWIYVDQLNGEWSSLLDIHEQRKRELNSLKGRLVDDFKTSATRLERKVETLQENWQSSKPVSGSIKPQDALFAVEKFDQEVTVCVRTQESLKSCAELLGLDYDFSTSLSDMKAEIKDFVSVWNAINTTWESLRSLENIPWSAVVIKHVRSSLSKLSDQTQEMPSRVRQYVAFQHVQSIVRDRIKTLGLLSSLKSESFHQRHWDNLIDKPTQTMTLGDVWAIDLLGKRYLIEKQLEVAQGEYRIEQFFLEIRDFWSSFTLELVSYHNKIQLIKNWDEIFSKVEDHLQSLGAMRNSPYFKVFTQDALDWEGKLNKIKLLFDEWVEVQRQWVYLEGVFTSSEIKAILPAESTKFSTVNSEMYAILRMVYKNPNALEVSQIANVAESMRRISDLLSKLQKSLGEFFERERKRFSRFYFVGDDDLLEMIGKFSIQRTEAHLTKMFAGISSFVYEGELLLGVCSPEQETLIFNEPLTTGEGVVEVLQRIEIATKEALKREINDAINTLDKAWTDATAFIEWLDRPLQAAIVATQVLSTKLHDDASYRSQYPILLDALAKHALSNLEPLARRRTETMITELVRQQNACQDMTWQLKFYWDESSSDLRVEQATASFEYGFEYLGAQTRLVSTPLVDDMFLTMTQALGEKLGGSPFGPAGTGKTESVKALGQALGQFVVVFCCDESFDFGAITRILLGICQTGAWACFDEFNRLEPNILSAVSTQVCAIEESLRAASDSIELDNKQGVLDSHTALFITMNPEYIGRHNLPDNIKNLFRSFAMKSPDKEKIVEVMLYSQGFQNATDLASKVVTLFEKLSSHMSSQKHYDWGLRALKNVLKIGGTLKRQYLDSKDIVVVKKACDESITPKLTHQDLEQYRELEIEVFGEGRISAPTDKLESRIREVGKERSLTISEIWLEKVLQLHRFLSIHHGIMLVGESATGKTQIWNALARVLDVEVHIINPKVLSKEKLFGSLDPTTREWTDGLFTQSLRKISDNLRGESRKHHWIVFDSEIDPDWAENLNSVLDDNKLLTLPSGERIKLPENVHILFEVSSLRAATPATVSRCGMIWVGDIVDTKMLISNGMHMLSQKVPEDANVSIYSNNLSIALPLLEKFDLEGLLNDTASLHHIMEFSVARALTTFWTLVANSIWRCDESLHAEEFLLKEMHIAAIWAFSGDCDTKERERFFKLLNAPFDEKLIDFDVSPISGQFIPWASFVSQLDLEPQAVADSSLVIPTVDTVKHENLLFEFLSLHQPVILCGPPGAGKTMTLLSALRRSDSMDVTSLNFSKTATPEIVIQTLEQKCFYKSTSNGLVLEPTHLGQWLVLFCDEINLPAPDKYGTQKVISLLRDMIEKRGFYKGTEWVHIERIQFVGACNPPTDVGRVPLDNRFLRHCGVVYVDYPTGESLRQIYTAMTRAILKLLPELHAVCDMLTTAMIDVYEKSQEKFQGKAPHYIYSPRELTRWCKGLYESLRNQYTLELSMLVRIWAYEGLRLFSDRLIAKEDRDWTWNLIQKTALECFGQACDISNALHQPILFTNWLHKEYRSVSRGELTEFLQARMKVFNEEVIDKDLTLFDDWLGHVLRIDRVLRQPQGHLILLGLSSSGKTTLTRFVCWMNGFNVFQLKTSRNYTEADFLTDLRTVLKRAGCEGQKLCFILDESALLDSAFLEKMNTLLANSEIPGLFENEEYASLLAACKNAAQRQGLTLDDEDDLMTWFNRQITQNLHVVFTINSSDDHIVGRVTTSPALFNRCVLNWMGGWSKKSMFQVCAHQISLVDCDHEIIPQAAVDFHDATLKYAAFTPGDYLSFLTQFKQLYTFKRTNLEDEKRHCHNGIDKLNGTMLDVRKLRTQLNDKQNELAAKDGESKLMLQQMLTDQSEAERKKEAGENIRAALETQNREIDMRKEEVYKDLEIAEPAVVEAQRGVSNIKKQHLNELRAFTNPPEAVKITLEAVCFVLGLKNTSWREVLQAVRGDEFIPNIVKFDNEAQMTPQVLRVLEHKYMKLPNFNYESVNRASKACGPLLQWVLAQVAYATVLQKVEPLKQEVRELEEATQEKVAQQNAIQEMLRELEASIESYKVEYAQLIADAQSIKLEMQNVQAKLERSIHLIDSLDSEKIRWKEAIEGFSGRARTLLGDCMLTAAFLSYAGRFDQKVRRDILDTWKLVFERRKIEFSETLDIVGFMSTGQDRLKWKGNGLRSDGLTQENAIIICQSIRCPLIIDPTPQAQNFLKKSVDPKIVVSSFLDSSFKKHVESAVRFGTSLLLQHAEHFDPVMMPLLNQEYTKRGGRLTVNFAGQEIDVSRDYKIFMISSDPDLQVMPHISSRTNLVNFTITRNSLEQIALDETLSTSRPEFEAHRRDMIKLQGEYQVELHGLEVQLLQALLDAQGNILENQEIVDTLQKIKSRAEEVKTKSSATNEAMKKIESAIVEYHPVSDHAGRLFALVDQLKGLEHNYQFSLDSFLNIFRGVLSQGTESVDLFVKELYNSIFVEISPALLEVDKRAFALALVATYLDEEVPVSSLPDINKVYTKTFNHNIEFFSTDESWYEKICRQRIPVLFQAKGFDPTLRLTTIATRNNKTCKVVALGSREGLANAENILSTASRLGHWVIVQNLQMAPQWMDRLQQQIPSLFSAHPEFRVMFVVQFDNSVVPVTLLRTCTLISVERTRSLKAGLSENLSILEHKFTLPPRERRRVYLSLCVLHAIIQERQRLITGFEKTYDFNDSDFIYASIVIDKLCKPLCSRTNVDPYNLPWTQMRYLISRIVYGPKLDSASDRDTVKQLIDYLFDPSVFETSFTFTPGVPETQVPEVLEYDTLQSWLNSLPSNEPPTWLGLDPDADDKQHELIVSKVRRKVEILCD